MQDLIAASIIWTLLLGMCVVAVAVTLMHLGERSVALPRGALGQDAHWLEGWLLEVGEHSEPEVQHHRVFTQSPDTVFSVLVQVLTSEAHFERIEGFGTAIVFTPQRRHTAPSRQLVARVRSHQGQTLVEVTSDEPPPATTQERQQECVRVQHLLGLVTHRLSGPTRVGKAAASLTRAT